ncbi:MAG: hypothetical protein AAB902_01390, partial [Patescibacteria group bacterium]
MKKINNKSINYSLKILTILAFVLIFVPFNKASAAYGTNITYCGTSNCESFPNYYSNYNNNSYYNGIPYQPPIYIAPPSITPVVYSNSVNPNVVSYTTVPKKKTVAKAKTNKVTVSDLTASAIYGSNSFLPSGLIQW